jgi:hypothetical protein
MESKPGENIITEDKIRAQPAKYRESYPECKLSYHAEDGESKSSS